MAQLGTRLLTLTVGAIDYSGEITNCRLNESEAEAGSVTFKEAKEGGARLFKLAFTGRQDPSTGSLWDIIWSQRGTQLPAILRPNGGTVASATEPTFTGQVIIAPFDGDFLGGEADASPKTRLTFDTEWEFLARPVRAFA